MTLPVATRVLPCVWLYMTAPVFGEPFWFALCMLAHPVLPLLCVTGLTPISLHQMVQAVGGLSRAS